MAEAHVFPLLKGYGGPSPYLKPVLGLLRALGYHTGVRKAPYEFQGGGDEMLVAKKPVPQGIGCGWPVSCRYGRALRVQRRRRLANMVRAVAPTLIKEARSCSASLASGGL